MIELKETPKTKYIPLAIEMKRTNGKDIRAIFS